MGAKTDIELTFAGENGAVAARRTAAAMIRVYFQNEYRFLPFDNMETEDADGWVHYPSRNAEAENLYAFRALLSDYLHRDLAECRTGNYPHSEQAEELLGHIRLDGNRLVISDCSGVEQTRLIESHYFEDFFSLLCLMMAAKMPDMTFEGIRRMENPGSYEKLVLTRAVYDGKVLSFEQMEGSPVYTDCIVSWTSDGNRFIKSCRRFPYVLVSIITEDLDSVRQDEEILKWIRGKNNIQKEMVSARLDFRHASPPEITLTAASDALCIRTRDELLAFLSARGYAAEVFSRLRDREFTGRQIVIPAYVTFIGEEAFRRRCSLESVMIPDSVTDIGAEAFLGCSSLTEINLPDSVLHIGNEAFRDCSSLKKVKLPACLRTVREGLFSGCVSLERITLPEGLRKIGRSAFSGCTGLKSIVIPETVWKFGEDVFSGCGPELSIRGKKGSEAERFAAENGIAFEAIE